MIWNASPEMKDLARTKKTNLPLTLRDYTARDVIRCQRGRAVVYIAFTQRQRNLLNVLSKQG